MLSSSTKRLSVKESDRHGNNQSHKDCRAGWSLLRAHPVNGAEASDYDIYAEFDEHDTPETKYIVVVDDYLPVATCRLYAIDSERVMLGRIVVLPEYRHQGLGTLVVLEAEKWAKELGFTTAVVESRDNKTHFYETMGYVADYSKKIIGEIFTCYRMDKQLNN